MKATFLNAIIVGGSFVCMSQVQAVVPAANTCDDQLLPNSESPFLCRYNGGYVETRSKYFPGNSARPPTSCGTKQGATKFEYQRLCPPGSRNVWEFFAYLVDWSCTRYYHPDPGVAYTEDLYYGECNASKGWIKSDRKIVGPLKETPPPYDVWIAKLTPIFQSCDGVPASIPLDANGAGGARRLCENYGAITGFQACPEGKVPVTYNKNLCEAPHTWIPGYPEIDAVYDNVKCLRDTRAGVCCGDPTPRE